MTIIRFLKQNCDAHIHLNLHMGDMAKRIHVIYIYFRLIVFYEGH